ncbi:MAG TPA: alkaline phosphatase PhoX, partial [Kiloniellaceae bacterium]|nr:alkaline phosphatase PhoX [Kiloniellaceae bacterium]
RKQSLFGGIAVATFTALLLQAQPAAAQYDSMMQGLKGWSAAPILTVGEEIGDYTPIGELDGTGAFDLDGSHVRVLVNHELLNFLGSAYEVSDGSGGSFELTGSRISYFDIDKATRQIVAAGLAYDTIYDANGAVATDNTFLQDGFAGFSRFCSAVLIEPQQFGGGRGLEDRIYFAGEEDGGGFNGVGGAEWALDPATGTIWQIPAMGHGAWENVTELDTGSADHVAFILADDTSPINFDDDEENEAAPLYLYIGEKNAAGDFLARNGLRDGTLYVWAAKNGEASPLDFNGTSGPKKLRGRWVALDNTPQPGNASEDGTSGFDEYGYPTQSNLWLQAKAAGAFGFSRPEDVDVNPKKGNVFALASTGVDTYAVDPGTGDGADTFGTVYAISVNFTNLSNPKRPLWGKVRILYDGDADPTRALRSPDNLDWSANGKIYVQEDKAEDDTLTGEPLFGPGAANPSEAGIVQMKPWRAVPRRIAKIDRNVVLDPTIPTPTDAVDVDAGESGAWESSGIVDVSELFGEAPGNLFLFTVQAHGIEDQADSNPTSRIVDEDLVEGGQLLFLTAPE